MKTYMGPYVFRPGVDGSDEVGLFCRVIANPNRGSVYIVDQTKVSPHSAKRYGCVWVDSSVGCEPSPPDVTAAMDLLWSEAEGDLKQLMDRLGAASAYGLVVYEET